MAQDRARTLEPHRFNSLVQFEYERGVPRNPFINAGAIVICDLLLSALANPKTATHGQMPPCKPGRRLVLQHLS